MPGNRGAGGNGRYTCEQVIAALQKTRGMVYLAAKELGCSHVTVYNYINRHPTIAAAKEAEEGKMGDATELKLYHAIMNDEHWAIAFYLSTKAKNRGYTKRQEITGAEGKALTIRVVYEDEPVYENGPDS